MSRFSGPIAISEEESKSGGGRYGWRPKLIEILRKSGISVTCYGDGWENPSLLEKEMIEIYSKSRINLGFSGVGYSSRLMCLKGRDFEVPMSGGLYLTQNNPELSLVYDVGAEILTYDNAKDCINKIKWVLNNPVIAKKIRENGRVAALERHTWKGRFKDIFQLSNFIN